nr:hypothetical protein [Elioraea sp.]
MPTDISYFRAVGLKLFHSDDGTPFDIDLGYYEWISILAYAQDFLLLYVLLKVSNAVDARNKGPLGCGGYGEHFWVSAYPLQKFILIAVFDLAQDLTGRHNAAGGYKSVKALPKAPERHGIVISK